MSVSHCVLWCSRPGSSSTQPARGSLTKTITVCSLSLPPALFVSHPIVHKHTQTNRCTVVAPQPVSPHQPPHQPRPPALRRPSRHTRALRPQPLNNHQRNQLSCNHQRIRSLRPRLLPLLRAAHETRAMPEHEVRFRAILCLCLSLSLCLTSCVCKVPPSTVVAQPHPLTHPRTLAAALEDLSLRLSLNRRPRCSRCEKALRFSRTHLCLSLPLPLLQTPKRRHRQPHTRFLRLL